MAIYLPFANKIISLFVPAGSASGVIDVARGYLFTVVPFYLVVCTKFVCDSVLRGAGAMRPFMVTTFSDLIIRVVLSIALFYVVGCIVILCANYDFGRSAGSSARVCRCSSISPVRGKRICLHSNRSQNCEMKGFPIGKPFFMTFSCLFLNNRPEFLQKELRRTRELPIFRFQVGTFCISFPQNCIS